MWIDQIKNYVPYDALEEKEKQMILDFYDKYGDDILKRESEMAHLTSSSMILNKDRTKVLMVYHNIYKSYSWTGGHNDGDCDFLRVAKREAEEETGVSHLKELSDGIYSLEIIPVLPHIKRGKQVGTHLHLNISFLFEADESEELRIKADENSDVKWIEIDKLEAMISDADKDMVPIYRKLLRGFTK